MAREIRLRVPSDHRGAFRQLADLESAQLSQLLSALRALSEPASRSDVTRELARILGDRSARDLTDSLFALETVRTAHGWGFQDVAGAVASDDTLDVPEEARPTLRARLGDLLEASQLARAAKSYELATAYEHDLHVARIISDIRPVFDDEVGAAPVGAVIVHQLELRVFEDGRSRTFYASMLDEDLDRLEQQVKRAREKSDLLGGIVRQAQLPLHHPDKE